MSKNFPHDNIYSILGKLDALKPTAQEKHDATVKQIYESVEAQGSILKGLRDVSSTEQRLAEQFAAEGKDQGKPGKTFAKIAKSAGEHYGSAEAGKRVAGAVKAKLAKAGKLEEKWGTEMHTAEKDKGMFKGKTQDELKSQLAKLKASGPHEKGSDAYKKQNQIEFALRAKHKFGKVGEQNMGPGTGGMEEDYASMGTGIGAQGGVVGEESLDEKAPPGMEAMVMKLKKEYPGEPEKAFATAWSIYNKKHGKAEESREVCDECSMHEDPQEEFEEGIHIGSYGTEYYGTKDFTGDDEDTAKSTEKKGRGRPTKASTGEKTSQERMPWGGNPPKDKYKPDPKGRVHSISDKSRNPDADAAFARDEKLAKHSKAGRMGIKESVDSVERRLLEGLNFKRMAEETHQSVDELMSELQKDIMDYKATGHCSEILKDFLQVHSHAKKQMADESAMEAAAQRPSPVVPAGGIHGRYPDPMSARDQRTKMNPPRSLEETDPLEEELNKLAELAGLRVADEGNAFTGKLKATSKGDTFDLDGKEYTDTSTLDEEPNEGNAFGKAVRDAKADGVQPGEKVTVGGKEYAVREAQELVAMLRVAGLDTRQLEEAIEKATKSDESCPTCDCDPCKCDEEKVDEDKIPVDGDKATEEELANAPDEEYLSMKASTMNPGEADSGEKQMNPDRPTFKNGDNALSKPPVRESVIGLESKLAAEYESIKKVS